MWDLDASLKSSQVRNKYIFGDRYFRIGNPFLWVDGDAQIDKKDFAGDIDLLQWVSGYYELYETPKELVYEGIEIDYKEILNLYHDILETLIPYHQEIDFFDKCVKCHALNRLQDYAFLYPFRDQISGINHIDFGPGMGGNATYSGLKLKNNYIGIEAHYWSYGIQRRFYYSLSRILNCKYNDYVSKETVLGFDSLNHLGSDNAKLKDINQIPSWNFDLVANKSVNLITATQCLNELNIAGIVWFLFNTLRTCNIGGFVYIRDSRKLKPGRHNVNYDKFLINNGFELVRDFEGKNRVDIYSLPRLYKRNSINPELKTFEDIHAAIFGHFGITSHGQNLAQNIKENN